MQDWLFLIPFIPFCSSILLMLFAGRINTLATSLLGVGSLAVSAVLTLLVGLEFYQQGAQSWQQSLFTWLELDGASIGFSLYLDQLSMLMMGVVCGVGFLIHWYAAAYMASDPHMPRFFAYMNLFVAAMLVLVLADNLVLLYLGWEGVGLCSFLLIGFWQQEKANARGARKAFVVTRIGDTALMLGLLMLFDLFASLSIGDILTQVPQLGVSNLDQKLLWICLLLLGGAVGKSAQLPLQTWLPDAMAGPTPVSALIHAATMVTAGVYLIARLHPLYLQVPLALEIVAWVGALTLVLAGLAALMQSDIKRVLAYSTMSQIGYMFLGLGVMAFDAAIFHLMTHAFFKALLFLCAGSIILKLHHQQDIFKMGGLARQLPKTSGLFLLGLLALVAVPGSAGFFSKEAILAGAWQASNPMLWYLGLFGALLTSLYSFRLYFLVCLGTPSFKGKTQDYGAASHFMLPLWILGGLALAGGYMAPQLAAVLPASPLEHPDLLAMWLPVGLALVGLLLAWWWFGPAKPPQPSTAAWAALLKDGLGFDRLYETLFTRPLLWFSRLNRRDGFDQLTWLMVWLNLNIHRLGTLTQNGQLRWYLAVMLAGGILMLGGLLWWR
ncbi:NADH-quinone oxidoreductase subunit L [Aliiglaciecola sp. CAU 1673]|uniref:NADH-quinone oxidoreductase subunit L n=1 Tax=Aliiglaciecola sp. CAU 1673 TaxID=3032595 RepID=UPI0023DA4304|nr:NADH-quinone oxidoreductase subunit L [Aliiglaciecola sp. CAU 1673]MDF2176657.1 NADH-quinone oxidoreductase subunit L [Aliiglaciecola sp. CAU 1673]